MRSRQSAIDRRVGVPPWLLLGLAIAASAAVASQCLADVIEIAPGGDTTTYATPAVFTVSGVTNISAALARSSATPANVMSIISDAAGRSRVSADLVTEVAWRESRFRQAATSNRDAVGVMQLTAATARDLGVNRFDVTQNIHGGAAYLGRMMERYGGDVRLALAAYNAGPGAVDRYHGVPPFRETQTYVAAILERLAQKTVLSVTPALFLQ